MEASRFQTWLGAMNADPVQFIGIRGSVGPSPGLFNDVMGPAGSVPCVNNPRVLLNRHSIGLPR
jgi:hypothetical protein